MKRIATLLALGLAIPAAAQKITTIAGDGTHRFSPDGSVAATSSIALALDSLTNVVLDPDGNLVFSEGNASRVRRILKKTGALETLAGNGDMLFLGPGPALETGMAWVNAPRFDRAGNIYFCATGNNLVLRLDAKTGRVEVAAGSGMNRYAGNNGPARAAEMNQPASLAVDAAGHVFIADTQNHAIRRRRTRGE